MPCFTCNHFPVALSLRRDDKSHVEKNRKGKEFINIKKLEGEFS